MIFMSYDFLHPCRYSHNNIMLLIYFCSTQRLLLSLHDIILPIIAGEREVKLAEREKISGSSLSTNFTSLLPAITTSTFTRLTVFIIVLASYFICTSHSPQFLIINFFVVIYSVVENLLIFYTVPISYSFWNTVKYYD